MKNEKHFHPNPELKEQPAREHTVEGGGDRDYVKREIKRRESYFNQGYKLDRSVAANISQIFLSLYSLNDEKGKAPHYAEYAQRENDEEPEVYELIIKRSDSESVAAFDKLVDEFNADFPRIIQGKDKEAIQKFVERAKQLVEAKK